MATKNFVPRATGEGQLGTSTKKWKDSHFSGTGSFGHIIVDGNITASGEIRADSFKSVTGGDTIDFNDDLDIAGGLTFSGNVSGSSGSCTGNSATATTAGQATLATTANAVATSTSGSGDQFVTFVDIDNASSQTHRVHGEVKYNTSNTTFTVNGTDIDGNSISESITSVFIVSRSSTGLTREFT